MFSAIVSPISSLINGFIELLQTLFSLFQPRLGRNGFERVYHMKLRSAAGRVSGLVQKGTEVELFGNYGPESLEHDEFSFEKYEPENSLQIDPPVIVFLHGGFWVASDRRDSAGVHSAFCGALAAKGFPVVSANYRLCRKADKQGKGLVNIEDQIDDVSSLCAYLISRDVFSCQKQGVLFVGHSAGGHLALQAALTGKLHEWENLIRGVYVLGGVYDLLDFYNRAGFFMRLFAFSRMPVSQTEPERLRSLSPKYTKNLKSPNVQLKISSKLGTERSNSLCFPLRLVHGAKDGFLLVQAQECVLHLQACKNRASLRILGRHDHYSVLSMNKAKDDTVLSDLAEFALDAAHSFVSGKAV